MIDRRGFLKVLGAVGGTFAGRRASRAATATPSSGKAAAAATKALASTEMAPTKLAAADADEREFVGILVDTTLCIGCRRCEAACAVANDLPAPDLSDRSVLDKPRTMSIDQFMVIDRRETSKGTVYTKRQCMHCDIPACASACLTKAMVKTEDGPVYWREDKCMGCRFCMVSCPFSVPRYEYHSAIPKVRKCTMCWERLQKDEVPACVAACPAGALRFGTRRELLDMAHARIGANPEGYVHHIYGEKEVGGTGYLYLSAVPFEELGFPTELDDTPYPEKTVGFLYSVPMVFLLWPAIMIGMVRSLRSRKQGEDGAGTEISPGVSPGGEDSDLAVGPTADVMGSSARRGGAE